MPVNIKADKIVNSSDDEFSFFFTDLQEGQGLVFNAANNRWENGVVSLADGRRGSLSNISEMNSLRFNGTNSYLSKNCPPSSISTWTWSIWFKNASLSGTRRFLRLGYSPFYYLSMNAEGAAGDEGKISGGATSFTENKTTQRFRDLSAWYHLVAVPTGVYINGNLILSHVSASMPSGGTNSWWSIGNNQTNYNSYFDGYMANIQFIDGQALDPNSFGETVSDVWVPKAYGSGDPANAMTEYGTNGFHLDFAASNMDFTNSKVLDASGRGNHWTLN